MTSSGAYGSVAFEVEAPTDGGLGKERTTVGTRRVSIVSLILLLVVGSLVAAHHSSSAGASSKSSYLKEQARGDIAYGEIVTSTTTYPFVVRIQVGWSDGVELCTGSIISPHYVITAAHCVYSKKLGVQITPGKVTVFAGTVNRKGTQPETFQKRIGEEVHVHPEWTTTGRDVALIRVKGGFVLSTSVNVVPLINARPLPGTLTMAAGWGSTETGSISDLLKAATMYVVNNSVCHRTDSREMCTQGGTGNTCPGDSGGPLILGSGSSAELVGLNSYSWTHCKDLTSNIDVFEGVDSHSQFIEPFISVPPPLELILKPNRTSGNSCSGFFREMSVSSFGKKVWKNAAKSVVVAFNGNNWVLANENILGGSPTHGFGGIEESTNGNVAIQCATFPSYVLTPSSIALKLQTGQSSYVNLAGGFVKTNTFINDYPIYVQGPFFIGKTSHQWVITLVQTLNGVIQQHKVNYPGYYWSTNKDTTLACAVFAKYDLVF